MKITRKLFAATAVASASVLVGCWGGGGDDPVATPVVTEVPDSAFASASAFVTYIMTLGANDESSEPLTIKDTIAVPPENSAEPTPLV